MTWRIAGYPNATVRIAHDVVSNGAGYLASCGTRFEAVDEWVAGQHAGMVDLCENCKVAIREKPKESNPISHYLPNRRTGT